MPCGGERPLHKWKWATKKGAGYEIHKIWQSLTIIHNGLSLNVKNTGRKKVNLYLPNPFFTPIILKNVQGTKGINIHLKERLGPKIQKRAILMLNGETLLLICS